MTQPLVPPEIQELFVELIAQGSGSHLRSWFEQAGIATTEARVLTAAPRKTDQAGQPIYMETLPMTDRVEHYFATVNWCDRDEIAKVLRIVQRALKQIQDVQPSGSLDHAIAVLARHDLVIDGDKILRSR